MRNLHRAVILALVVLAGACSDGPAGVQPLVVHQVTVAPSGRVLTVGDTMRVTAYPATADGTVLGGVPVEWRSEADAVAAVRVRNGAATVEAKAPGTTRVLATSGGKTGHVTVTVVAAPLRVARIEIVQGDGTIRIGQETMLEAVLYAADNTVIGGRPVQWTSSAGPVATVTSAGNDAFATLLAHTTGTAVITAASGGVQTSVVYTVLPTTSVVRVEIVPAGATFAVGSQQTIHAVAYSADSAAVMGLPVQWQSSNPAVLTVSPFPGMTTAYVHAVSAGVTTVSATVAGVRRDVQFTVTAPPPPTPIAFVIVQPQLRGLWAGQTVQYQARTYQADGLEVTGRPIVFSVDDASIASVDGAGLAIARTAGRAEVTAESGGVAGTGVLHVYELADVMSFELTYDWWDSQVRTAEPMGILQWTDAAGVERESTLHAATGTFTIDRTTGTYTRVIEAIAGDYSNGVYREVGRQTFTDTGAMYYRWDPYVDGATTFDFVSTSTPGLRYTGVFRQGGQLKVSMPVYAGQVRDVLFRIGS